jgi:hypothetical protein
MDTRLSCVTVLVAMSLALAACGGGDTDEGGSPPGSVSGTVPSGAGSISPPTLVPSVDTHELSGSFDVGRGRHLYAECEGTGSPTILLESGDEDDLSAWRAVYPDLITETRTCRYDRLGLGSSDNPTGCRKAADFRRDTESLLAAMGIDGPLLVVGSSGGGFLMANYAYAHSDRVQGIVLVETPHAIVPGRESPDLIAALDCHTDTNIEHRDYVQIENAAWSHRHLLGRIPVSVISNDYGSSAVGAEQAHNVPEQKGWLVLSPLAQQVVVTSGHDVAENEPDLVVAEILKVLVATRAG